MGKKRQKLSEVFGSAQPQVAVLPDSAPATPFLDPSIAQAEPRGSELYNLGTVQQAAESTRDADMFNPSYLQEPRNYPTGAEGGVTRPEGASPLLYPSTAETQPRLKVRRTVGEALALAEVNRPRRKSVNEAMDQLAVGMFDPSKTPLPQDLWDHATQRRSKMIQDGRLPMEFGEIDSLADGLVWTKDAAYGAASYIAGTLGGAAAAVATNPAATARQLPATIGSAVQRTATEFGLQTYQDIFNLTHEPKYRVKETGEFVAVNKTGLPLVMPAASGGNNVLSGDGIIDPRMPEQGIRSFAEQGKTLVPVTEQDLKDYRYGQYLDRMAMGAQSLEAQNFRAPSNLAQQALATSAVTAPLAAFLAATDPGGTVGPTQPLAEVAVLAAQSAVPMGAASRSWGISRRVAGGLSKVAGAAEGAAGFFPDVETALRAKFVKTVTSGTNLDAGAQKTVLQSAIDGGKTLGIAGGAYAAATGLSAIEGVPGELKQAAWTAANLYSGYKGGMFVARQLRSASGFAKTVLKEVADPAQGLDVGARMRVAANPDVPDFVRNVLRNPSSFRAMESTPARLAKNQALSPAARAVFGKLSDYRFVQAARLAKDAAAGVPKGMVANVPFVAGAMASDDPERAGQMLAAGGVFGAMGGAAGRFTEARQRSMERAEGDIARLLVDIQAGNELGSGLGGDIMRNRVRPGTQFQDGPGGFVLNPDREVSSFLTEVEMAGGDVSAFVRGKSFDELAQWAAYQGFFRDKVDLVPLNATDFKLNAEANGQNGAGAYFLQPSEGRRARVFVNAESRRNGLAPHEYGHAVLRGGALSPDQIDAVHAEINARYAPDALRNMAGEYAATMVRAENAKQGINIEPSPAAITAKVNELSQGSMIKGSADGLDWLREEIFAEEFRNANIDMNRARRNIPLGANPVSFFENLLGAQSRALHMAGIDIDPQTGKPMGRDQIFKENRVAAGDPVVMKNYADYVKQWKRWINDPTHEVDPGVPLSKTGNPQDTANSPNVTWKDYGRGRMETEFAVKNPDGSVTPKDWKRDIKPTVKARQQAVREMSNRSKEVDAADDQTFGMRRRRDGRLETSGRRLPDSFFFIPQYKPFHDILRKINAADDIGETLQVRFFAKGKSKDVFKDGIKNTSAVNREALHGNFVAKKDGTLMWGWLDMTQFRNRAMKAIADKNPALAQYDWNLKAIMDDLPVHLTDQRRGKGGAFSVGPERANILNGLIGIGDGPLVGAFGKGTAYKTIHLDSIDTVVPTGKTGGEFDVYRANRNAMPDDPKPPVDMETDIDNNRMPQQIPREAQGMPDVAVSGRGDGMPEINITPDEARRQGLIGPVFHGSPDFKGRKFDPKYRARSSGLSRGGFSFTEDVASADSYAGAGVDSAQAAVDAANDVMRDLGARMEKGLKLREFADISELPEFNVRYVDDMDGLASYFNDLSKRIPKDLGARLRDAAKAINEPANPVVVEAYLRNPKEMMIDGKRLLLAENPDDIFVSAARSPQDAPSAAPRGQAMPDAAPADAPPFYMKSAQVLDSKIQGKAATADQVRAILKNPQNGIKAEELKWTGIEQAVERIAKENGGKVPKEALLRYLQEDGAVRLEEVVLPEDSNITQAANDPDFDPAMYRDDRAKFGQYQLPGGANYREVVLAMPAKAALRKELKEVINQFNTADDPNLRSQLEQQMRQLEVRMAEMPDDYASSHFQGVPNYVAHMRLNERTDAAGKPGLFLEEVQSDRHQAGREQGYREPFEQWIAFYDAGGTEVPIGYGRSEKQALESIDKNWEGLVKIQTRKRDGVEGIIPDAPFRKDWPMQMFKRALADAVSSGKEWIGWTTGETQAARYDLSKQVKSIDVIDHHSGQGRFVDIRGKDGESVMSMRYNDKGIAEDGKPLSDYIGKELAEKVMKLPSGKREGSSFLVKRFSGIDLKVGGEGMKGFYDQILPKEISKYVKQWGGQVEKSSIGKPPSKAFAKATERFEEAKRRHGAESQQAIEALMAIPNESGGAGVSQIWRVNITPQMREGIKKAGQALFVGGMAAVVAEQEEQ